MGNVIHEDEVKYDLWIRYFINCSLALTLVCGIWFAMKNNTGGAAVMIGLTIFDSVLYWTILPNKYSIYEDRFIIHLGLFSYNIPFNSVAAVRSLETWFALGLSFAGSMRNRIEIVRTGSMNVIVSPNNRDLFLKIATDAIAKWEINNKVDEL